MQDGIYQSHSGILAERVKNNEMDPETAKAILDNPHPQLRQAMIEKAHAEIVKKKADEAKLSAADAKAQAKPAISQDAALRHLEHVEKQLFDLSKEPQSDARDGAMKELTARKDHMHAIAFPPDEAAKAAASPASPAAPAAQKQDVPTISSRADLEKLPAGTAIHMPDGTVKYRK